MSHLTPRQRALLNDVILKCDPLFLLEEGELGTLKAPPVHIIVADPRPIRGPTYRYPENAKVVIGDMLQDMEKKRNNRKSTSAWWSPIVLVNKPDGTKRMCLDYRKVN